MGDSTSAAPPAMLRIALAGLLAAATLLAHGWSLTDPLFFDDHWHQAQLARGDWSLQAFFRDTTLDPPRFIHIWWQERPARWQYARPLAVLLAKITHALSGGSVVAQHAVSLGLHWLTALLVMRLARQLTGNTFWSVVAGLLMVVYSHSVFAVGWLAAQNTLLQTVLCVAALLTYARASQLAIGPPWLTRGAVDVPPVRSLPLLMTIVQWVAALLARENAVIMPAVFASLDLAFGGRRWVWRRLGVHALLCAIALAYAAWRLLLFYEPVPDVYFQRPDGRNYPLWLLAKMMHYVCSAIWLSPMTVGPTGRYEPFSDVPGDCLLMAAILLVMGGGYSFATRRAPGWWIWPLWVVLALLPVAPVLATPHSGYMAGVGFALAMVLGAGLGKAAPATGIGRWRTGVATWFLIATCTYIPIYRNLWSGMLAADRYTSAFLSLDAPPRDDEQLYFIDLPFVNVYVDIAGRKVWGQRTFDVPVRAHVLTFAPELVAPRSANRVEQIDDHRLRISATAAPYFSGLLGRFLVGGLGAGKVPRVGERFETENFTAVVLEGDLAGARVLEFTFREPLWSPGNRFYLTTPEGGAIRLAFVPTGPQFATSQAETPNSAIAPPPARAWPNAATDALVHGVLQDAGIARLHAERARLFSIRAISSWIVRTDLYLSGPPYPGPR